MLLKTKAITFSGIMVSMILLFASISFFSPINDFFLFTLKSICVALVIIYYRVNYGFAVYIASSLLLFIIFGIYFAFPFILFFGNYPIIITLLRYRFKGFIYHFCKQFYIVVIASVFAIIIIKIIGLNSGVNKLLNAINFQNSNDEIKIYLFTGVITLVIELYDLLFAKVINQTKIYLDRFVQTN